MCSGRALVALGEICLRGPMKLKSVGLVLAGLAVGCGAAAVAPMARSFAQAPAGAWDCFAVERFPDVEKARSQEFAVSTREGLNRVARQVPTGTMLSVTPYTHPNGSMASVACVKN